MRNWATPPSTPSWSVTSVDSGLALLLSHDRVVLLITLLRTGAATGASGTGGGSGAGNADANGAALPKLNSTASASGTLHLGLTSPAASGAKLSMIGGRVRGGVGPRGARGASVGSVGWMVWVKQRNR